MFAAIVALIGLALFIFLFTTAMWESWKAPTPSARMQPNDVDDPRNYVATSLAGSVGGGATYFGIPETAAAVSSKIAVQSWVVPAYLTVYIAYGSEAILIWLQKGSVTYIAVRNLAATFLGMIPFIAMSVLRLAG